MGPFDPCITSNQFSCFQPCPSPLLSEICSASNSCIFPGFYSRYTFVYYWLLPLSHLTFTFLHYHLFTSSCPSGTKCLPFANTSLRPSFPSPPPSYLPPTLTADLPYLLPFSPPLPSPQITSTFEPNLFIWQTTYLNPGQHPHFNFSHLLRATAHVHT